MDIEKQFSDGRGRFVEGLGMAGSKIHTCIGERPNWGA